MAKIIELPKYIGIALITCYSALISPFLGPNCRYYPSCSHYTKTAMCKYGLCIGLWLGLRRILRCHPWHEGGYDPVPDKQIKVKT